MQVAAGIVEGEAVKTDALDDPSFVLLPSLPLSDVYLLPLRASTKLRSLRTHANLEGDGCQGPFATTV